MRDGIIRFTSLLVYNIAVLYLIGLLTRAEVGLLPIWAGIVMTLLVMFVKPIVTRWFRSMAAKSRDDRTTAGEHLVQALLVLAVAAVVWALTVLLSRVQAPGVWAFVLPPVFIAIGWFVYSKIADRIHERAGAIYDRIERRTGDAAPAASPETAQARAELDDGLTPEQRRMLDEL